MKTHYDVLGVPVTATPEQIVTAYRLRSKVLHPDRFDPSKQRTEWELANELLKELNASYAVLRDPATRVAYDRAIGVASANQTSGTNRSSTTASQRTQRTPPPPPRSVVPPLSAGYAIYSTLPTALQRRLRDRCAGKVSPQFKVRTGGVILAYALLGIVVCVAAIALLSAGTERWDPNTIPGAILMIFMGCGASAYSLFQICRWHASPLKRHLIITPLYIVETQLDEVWNWPIWHVKALNGTHRYYNGIYYGTDTVFTFEKTKRSYRFRHEADYKSVVDALRVFSQKALSAEQQSDLQYFADEDEFASVHHLNGRKRSAWKLAVATTTAAAVAALVFAGAIFVINSMAPKAKPVHLGASRSPHTVAQSSSSNNLDFEPVPAAHSDHEPLTELPYDPSIEPANGAVFRNELFRGDGTLKITNGTSDGAIVKLVSTRLNRSLFTVFIAPNSNFKIANIPDDTYRLAYAIGRRFNPFTDTFDRLYGISVFDNLLRYDTRTQYESDGRHTYYHAFDVTLQPVVGGNARTSSLAAQSFEQF